MAILSIEPTHPLIVFVEKRLPENAAADALRFASVLGNLHREKVFRAAVQTSFMH
eukprot:IDg2675t1